MWIHQGEAHATDIETCLELWDDVSGYLLGNVSATQMVREELRQWNACEIEIYDDVIMEPWYGVDEYGQDGQL